jgi:glycosyltransferase involved in cell wall biosynthesis
MIHGERRVNGMGESPKGTYLFIVPWDLTYPGGVNQVVINLYREIERLGRLRPLILVLDWHSTSPTEEVSAQFQTIRLRIRQPASHGIYLRNLITYLFTLPVTLWRLRKLIARYDVRVINAQYPTLATLNFALLQKLGLFKGKLFLSFQGLDIRNAARTRGLENALWRWLARSADALTTCSESLAEEIRVLGPRLTRPPVTVHNSIDPTGLLREKLPLSAISRPFPQRRYILNVATFEHKKGHDVLIKAFARIAKDILDVDLVIIGGDGPTWDEDNARVVAAGLENRVICLRNMPHGEVLAYMEKATVYAFPSRYEPLGIAMLEAAVFGVPVVASRVDGIPEVINSEEVGILFESEDDKTLEAALRKLLTNDELRVALGRRLQKRVVEEFTWAKAWEKYSALIGGHEVSPRVVPSRVSVGG